MDDDKLATTRTLITEMRDKIALHQEELRKLQTTIEALKETAQVSKKKVRFSRQSVVTLMNQLMQNRLVPRVQQISTTARDYRGCVMMSTTIGFLCSTSAMAVSKVEPN